MLGIFEKNIVKVERCDFLKERKVIQDVDYHTQITFFITFNHGNIQILERNSIQSKVYCHYNNRTFWVENEFVTKDMKAYDYTNYEIPLKKGDTVKEVFAYQDKVQIKKNGILGWTYCSNLE